MQINLILKIPVTCGAGPWLRGTVLKVLRGYDCIPYQVFSLPQYFNVFTGVVDDVVCLQVK